MLNKAIIMGRLTKEPELRMTQSNIATVSFNVAVDRDFASNGAKETDFVNCIAWRQTAEFISKYFHKGSMIVAVGRIQTRNYETNSGEKKYVTEVVAENVYFGESKKNENAASTGFTELDEDERLPWD